MELTEKIRVLRELKEMSQAELADKIHMSTEGYAKIERGERGLDIQRLTQIANALNISVPDLLSITDKSELYLVNDNHFCIIGKENNHTSYYHNADTNLILENEKLKLELEYKDKLLEQKERENTLLKELVEALKSQKY